MCAPSPPPAPDYVGAAKAQGAENKDAAIASSKLNNPNVYGPTGSQVWTESGPDGRPTLTQSLSPERQATASALERLASTGANSLQGIIGSPFSLEGLPGQAQSSEATRKRVLDAMSGRIEEDYASKRDRANSEMIARGLRPGTKAYQDEMYMLDRARNDARNQAEATAGGEVSRQFGMDTEGRKNALAELLLRRQWPINEITALLSGTQIGNPFAMPGASQGANIQGAPLFAATNALSGYNTDVYNSQAAGRGNFMSGLFGLGAGGLSGGYF